MMQCNGNENDVNYAKYANYAGADDGIEVNSLISQLETYSDVMTYACPSEIESCR